VIDLSIVVCTRDRMAQLQRCLERLVTLRPPPGAMLELIVVDNGSRDQTPAVIRAARERGVTPLIAVEESQPGLARARNRGLAAARGATIAFTDDDCLVAADWPEQLLAAFSNDLELGMLGGRVELADPSDRTVTIKTKRERQVLRDAIGLDGFIHGCNHALRRAVVERIGGYDPRFGHGSRIPGGEDTDFVWRAHLAGFKVAYEPAVVVAHAHGRKTEAEEDRLRRDYRIAIAALQTKHVLKGDRAMWAWARRDLARNLVALGWGPKGAGSPTARLAGLRRLRQQAQGVARFLVATMGERRPHRTRPGKPRHNDIGRQLW
jgi:GT2 family glycosyltransferase